MPTFVVYISVPVVVRHTNPETPVTLLQEHITKIEKWLQDEQIKANLGKCNQYYIYTKETETTKYPIERDAHNTNKAS